MNKRLRKKLMLGEFQNWIFELSLRYDPARVQSDDLFDAVLEAIEASQMFCGGGGAAGEETFVVSFNVFPDARERESLRQVLAGHLRELQARFDFEFQIGPLQVDLSKASERAPRQADMQRRENARLGIEEFAWEESSCGSGCDCCSR